MKKVTRYFGQLNKRTKAQFIFLFVVTFIVMISQTYGDFYITMRQSITFWTALFDGKPWDFYSYCAEGGVGSIWGGGTYIGAVTGAAYDFPIYLYFAIWDFPVWLYEKISGLNAQGNILWIVYAKSVLLLTTYIATYYMVKIQKKISPIIEFAKGEMELFFLSSCIIISYVAITGNYDIIGIMFMLIGYYYYLNHENKKFILFFAIAVSLKYFALLPFLLIVLYRQKNVLKIIRDIILGCSIVLISKGIFFLTASNKSDLPGVGVPGMNNIFMEQILPVGLGGRLSIFVFVFFLLCIWAYCSKEEDNKMYATSLYFCFAAFAIFLLFCSPCPYWNVILIPFLVLIIFMNEENRYLNILLETIFEIALLLFNTLQFNWVMANQTCVNMFFYKVFYHNITCRGELYELGDGFSAILLKWQDKFDLNLLFGTFAFASLLVLLVINFPLNNRIKLNCAFKEETINKLLITRLAFMLAVVLLPVTFYVAGILICILRT